MWFPPRKVFHLVDSEFGEVLRRPGQYSLTTPRNDRPLDEFRMLGHNADKVIIAEILVRDVLLVGGFILTQCVLCGLSPALRSRRFSSFSESDEFFM